MSNKQAQPSTKVGLVNLLAVLHDGSVVHLDLGKVSVINKATKMPIFKEKK